MILKRHFQSPRITNVLKQFERMCSCCHQKTCLLFFCSSFSYFNYDHCHLPVLSFLFLMNLLSSFVVFFLYSIFSLCYFFSYLFVCVYLFVSLASAQAPLPLHLRTRLCLPPLIGQSVPTLARSVFRPRRWTMQVHGLSITFPSHITVAESLQTAFSFPPVAVTPRASVIHRRDPSLLFHSSPCS